jgi:tetratricopeptide (TPR) repeat protein
MLHSYALLCKAAGQAFSEIHKAGQAFSEIHKDWRSMQYASTRLFRFQLRNPFVFLLMTMTACAVSSGAVKAAGFPYDGSCTNASPLEQQTAGWVMACVDIETSPRDHRTPAYVPKIEVRGPANFLRLIREQCDGVATRPKDIVDGQVVDHTGGGVDRAKADRCVKDLFINAKARELCGQHRIADDTLWGPAPLPLEEMETCKRQKIVKLLMEYEPNVRALCTGLPDPEKCVDTVYNFGSLQSQKATPEQIAALKKRLRDREQGTGVPDRQEQGYAPGNPEDAKRCPNGLFYRRNGQWVCEERGGSTHQADSDESTNRSGLTLPAFPSSGSPSTPSSSGASRPLGARPQMSSRSFRAPPRNRQSTITGREFGDAPGVRGYDSRQMAVVAADGRKVNAQPLIAALQKVSPQAAQAPFTTNSNGSLALSPSAQRAIAENGGALRNVGGVALDVTFDNLTQVGLSMPRPGEPAAVVESPILISLQRLVAAAKPFAISQARWAQLPEDIRYPGGIGRVRGFMLDPDTKDVFVIGTDASSKETRLDIDVFITLLDVAWSKGLTPAVSLDRQPGPNGEVTISPQVLDLKGDRLVETPLANYDISPSIRKQVTTANYPRLVNLPADALVSRILLDADFEMKRVANGAIRSPSKDFKSEADLLAEQGHGDGSPLYARFWFHPIPLRPNTVRVASSGNLVLYDAGVQLLTENLTEGGQGTGDANPRALKVAESVSRLYSDIESWPGLQTPGIFTLLKGVNDVQTMCKLMRDAAVNAPVLEDLRKLPYRHLEGVQAVPAAYRGVTVVVNYTSGDRTFLSGGIELRARATRRTFDHGDDGAAVVLQAAAGRFPVNTFKQVVPVTFTLASQTPEGNAPSALARAAGERLFASGQVQAAIVKLDEATTLDPLDIDGWTMLAVAQASAGKAQAANASLDRARLIDPYDPAVQLSAVRIAFIAKTPIDVASLDTDVRNDASDMAVQRGYSKLNVSLSTGQPATVDDDVAEALKLRPDNDQAYFLRGLARFGGDDYVRALEDISEVIRLKPDRADAYDLRGTIYKALQRYDDSFKDFDHAIQLRPDSARSYDGRGNALLFMKNYKGAIADFDKAIALRPDFAWAFFKRGLAFVELQDSERAIANFSDAIKFDPSNSFAYARRGTLLAEKGENKKALEDFNRALKLDSGDSFTFHGRADLFRSKGDLDAALSDYGKAIALNPRDDKARAARAMILINQKQGADAVRELDEAIKVNPSVSMNYLLRGDAQMLMANADRAASDYDQAIKLDPKSGLAHVHLGTAHVALRQPDLAMQDFTRAIAINPRDAIALADRGRLYMDQGKADLALSDLNAATSIDGSLVPALTNRGVIYERQGDLSRAMSDFEAVIKLDPQRAGGYTNRGNVYQDKGDLDRAIDDFSHSLSLQPQAADVLTNRGGAYAAKNQFDLAVADFNAALKIDPRFPEAYSRRGEIYRKQKKFDAALADFEQALAVNPKQLGGLYGRGMILSDRKQYDRAIADFTALLALKPNFGQAFHERGVAYQAKGDLDRAVSDYSEDIRIDPQGALISYYNRGEIYRQKKDYDRALGDYNAALRIHPSWPPALAAIQDAQAERSGRKAPSVATLTDLPSQSSPPAKEQPSATPTMAELNAAIQADPKSVVAYYRRGVLFSRSGDKARALADYNQAIALNPKSVEALTNRGILYSAQNDDARAIDDFSAAIKINPAAALPLFNRGVVLLRAKKIDPAIADLSEAVRLSPKDPIAYYFRATAYVGKMDDERALSDLNESIRLDATHPETLSLRARLYLDRGKIDLAAADVATALSLQPENVDNVVLRGQVKFVAKDWDGALADFNAALQRDPRNLAGLVYRSRVYLTQKNQVAALVDLNGALQIDPRQPEALYYRGVVELLNNQFDPALKDFEAAAVNKPNDAQTFFYIGFANTMKKDLDRAILAYTKAIELNPNYAEAYKLRADAYKNKGDTVRAESDNVAARRLATSR